MKDSLFYSLLFTIMFIMFSGIFFQRELYAMGWACVVSASLLLAVHINIYTDKEIQ